MLVSEITAFLEQAYDVLNETFFEGELSKVVITVQSSPKCYGHYTTWDAWKEEQRGYREINIAAETLNRPIGNVIATLVHEMVHHYCDMRGIKDTSRGGVYHNKRFKEQAELRGLILDYDSRIGFSITHPSLMLMDLINSMGWQNVNLARNGGVTSSNGSDNAPGGAGGADAGKKKSSTRKYICPICGCSVRATKVVNIACLDCQVQMIVEEK
ncbi:MAG: SprT-like family protein [Clostridia bacterium]|nr:SprT-like family protein [Clostridia bacterium]